MANSRDVFNRLPLLAVFAMLTLAVTVAFLGHASHASNVPDAKLVAERDLRFVDRDDGAVIVYAGTTDQQVAVFEGQQGFLRGTMRGFVRTRHLDGIGAAPAFRLSRWSDGRLTLDDPTTGQHVELLAFGPTNAAVFAPLLASN